MRFNPMVSITISTGLALFAMFFGAGNMIFPLKVGVMASGHVFPALCAFIISGVGVPFLGVFAVSLYEGNYWKFFNRLSRPISFVVVTFLILFIGPLFAGPRTEVITFSTLLPLLPDALKNPYLFTAFYFGIILAVTAKQTRIVDIIGWFFSPIKIVSFTTLILISLYVAVPAETAHESAMHLFSESLTMGYGTMDLLAAFFFCSVAYRNIHIKSQQLGIHSQRTQIKMMLSACLIGAFLISIIYTGFIYAASAHAVALMDTPTEGLIAKIAEITLGRYGELFVGMCVSVACLATGATLAEVTTDYMYHTALKQRVPRAVCLIGVIIVMCMMSILGFDGIMRIALPILDFLYPVLILLCIVNIALKLTGKGTLLKRMTRSNNL